MRSTINEWRPKKSPTTSSSTKNGNIILGDESIFLSQQNYDHIITHRPIGVRQEGKPNLGTFSI